MKFRFLGTGTAGGIPLYGCDCPVCTAAQEDPRLRRQSACALVETHEIRILIDAGLHGLGERLPAGSFDQVLLTHYHMDHVHGLFGIRWGTGISLPVIGPDDPQGCDDLFKHPGILDFSRKAQPFETLQLADLAVTPLPLVHSRPTLGYHLTHEGRSLAYLTDTCGLPPDTAAWLKHNPPDVLVIDCSHPPLGRMPDNHNDLDLALQIVADTQPGEAYLTHVDHRLDQWLLDHPDSLPDGVALARDGLMLTP